MKKIILLLAAFFLTYTSNAQLKTPKPSPKSTVNQVIGMTDVTLEYFRPSAKGRNIFGDLVPFGKMWRTGANENTTISFSEEVMIDGKKLAKGKYALFTLPKADNWEFIFYTDTSNWGVPEVWEESKVALRANVKPLLLNKYVETLNMTFNNLDNNFGMLEITWEKTYAALKIEVPTEKVAMESIEKVLNGPSSGDYFSAAQYFFQSNKDMTKALGYINKAIELSKEREVPFWYLRQKSLIQAKMGDKKGAIETAKLSLAAATTAKNTDYIKMNNDSITEWSKK
jgi:tetratricopeptide (TPR) repeat protein